MAISTAVVGLWGDPLRQRSIRPMVRSSPRRHWRRPADPGRSLVDDLVRVLGETLGASGTDAEAMQFFAQHLRDVARSVARDLTSADRERALATAQELAVVCGLDGDDRALGITGAVVELVLGPPVLTTAETARALGVSVRRVEDLLADGGLEAADGGVDTGSVVRRLAGRP